MVERDTQRGVWRNSALFDSVCRTTRLCLIAFAMSTLPRSAQKIVLRTQRGVWHNSALFDSVARSSTFSVRGSFLARCSSKKQIRSV